MILLPEKASLPIFFVVLGKTISLILLPLNASFIIVSTPLGTLIFLLFSIQPDLIPYPTTVGEMF